MRIFESYAFSKMGTYIFACWFASAATPAPYIACDRTALRQCFLCLGFAEAAWYFVARNGLSSRGAQQRSPGKRPGNRGTASAHARKSCALVLVETLNLKLTCKFSRVVETIIWRSGRDDKHDIDDNVWAAMTDRSNGFVILPAKLFLFCRIIVHYISNSIIFALLTLHSCLMDYSIFPPQWKMQLPNEFFL